MEKPTLEQLRRLSPHTIKTMGTKAMKRMAMGARSPFGRGSITYAELDSSAGFHATGRKPSDSRVKLFLEAEARVPDYCSDNPYEMARGQLAQLEMPDSVRDFVLMSYYSRFNLREAVNWKMDREGANKPEDIAHHIEQGHDEQVADVLATLDRMQRKDLVAVPLMTIDLPPFSDCTYEEFVKFQESINRAIVATDGGVLVPRDQRVRYKLRTTNSIMAPGSPLEALLFTEKEAIGRVHDDTCIIRRTSFVLRGDSASGYPRTLIQQASKARGSDVDEWLRNISETIQFGEVFTPSSFRAELWGGDGRTIVPNAVTFYAYNRTTDMRHQRAGEQTASDVPDSDTIDL